MHFFYGSKKTSPELSRKLLLIRLSILFGLFFFSTSFSFAQYRIETWSTDQGLPYKTVNSVWQTRDGYLWAATADGLARFDGVRFTVFNTANTPELVSNRFGTLVESNDGSLWVAIEKRGLIRYKDGIFSNYTTLNGLPSDWIFSLQYFSGENLLLVGTSAGMAHFDGEKFVRDDLPNLTIGQSQQTIIDNTGAIWKKDGDELSRADGKGAETLTLPKMFTRSLLNLFYRDRAGNYWLALDDVIDGYLVKFQGGKSEILSDKDGLPGGIINAIFEDSKGNLWFGSKNEGGLSIYQNGKFQHLTKKDGLSSNGFTGFFEDGEGGVWAATFDGGLMRFSSRIVRSFAEKDGLSGKGVYPLFEDRAGTIWVGDWGPPGLRKYENSRFQTLTGATLFTSIFEDREGVLWIGSYNQIGKIENGKYSIVYSLPQIATSAIVEDSAGNLWFGSGDGLRRMKAEKNNQPAPINLIPDPPELFDHFTTKNGLPADDIKILHFDRNGTLWIGTTGGLAKFDGEKITAFTEKDGLSGNHIRSIYEDADGILWFGTYDNGLTRLKDGKFTTIRVKDGLFDQGVFQILEDDFGRFWISSNRGIYRVSREQLNDFADGKADSVTCIGYSAKDGMLDAECNGGSQPAGFKSKKDGTLWFPTQKGVAVVDPKSLPVNTSPPNVVIENCLLDGKEIDCFNFKILPENESLEIKYTALSFNKSDQIKFRYNLEGLDEKWIDAGTRRRAFFTHLPPGEYSFRVTAANVDGIWNETGASLKIVVKPPFYLAWWFWAISLLVLASLLYVGYKRRTDFLNQRALTQEKFSRQLLESQEQERQRIAVELHDSLGQDLLIIKNWAMIGLSQNSDPEKTKKQLSEISQTASLAIEEVREISYNLRPYHLDELGLTKAIESMCDRVSRASQISVACSIENLDGFFPKVEEINFYRIVQECLNNIVKHSEATETGILIKCDPNSLHLEIKDNGRGFNVEETKLNLQNGNRRSLGLVSLIERSRILGGKPVIESTPQQGTRIVLHLVKEIKP
jgi:signal transduction histidine kinase/ligand-binding sensor domain-containing protein